MRGRVRRARRESSRLHRPHRHDIGATSAILRDRSEKYNSGWFDPRADDRFWFAYGQLYGYYGILTAAHADFRGVIAQRGLTQHWTELEDQLRASLRIQPMIISNGDESGWLMPAHLDTWLLCPAGALEPGRDPPRARPLVYRIAHEHPSC